MSNYDTSRQYTPDTSPTPPQPPPAQNKSKTLMWILVGCGGMTVVALIVLALVSFFVLNKAKEAGLDPALIEKNPALAAAKMVVAANPELELVSVDEAKGVITVRDKKTGDTVTVNFEQAAEGKIEFSTEDKGTVTLEASGDESSGSFEARSESGTFRFGPGSARLPEWLPAYPGSNATATYSAQGAENESGAFSFQTDDSIEQIISFYEAGLKSRGFKVETSLVTSNGRVSSGIATGEDRDKKRNAFVTAVESEGRVTVSVTFAAKK